MPKKTVALSLEMIDSRSHLTIAFGYDLPFRSCTDYIKSPTPVEQYSASSVRAIFFRHAIDKTNITKEVTLHTLRHCYATHLLEKGADLRCIQHLLGHNSSKTIKMYTHVSSQKLETITSPYDTL